MLLVGVFFFTEAPGKRKAKKKKNRKSFFNSYNNRSVKTLRVSDTIWFMRFFFFLRPPVVIQWPSATFDHCDCSSRKNKRNANSEKGSRIWKLKPFRRREKKKNEWDENGFIEIELFGEPGVFSSLLTPDRGHLRDRN